MAHSSINITFTVSRVTKKFIKKMVGLQFFVFGGICLNAVAITISGILIASKMGLGATGVYTLAAYTATLLRFRSEALHLFQQVFYQEHGRIKTLRK